MYAQARFALLMLGIFVLGAIPAGASEGEDVLSMEEMVVTGSRTEQSVRDTPANITVIDNQTIRNANAQSVVELLKQQEGLFVRDLLGNGKSAQVDLRGFGESGQYNTLVLVDGRRVNAIDLSGVDWSQISLNQIERIEILRGTGSVLYGDNAVGGVINIITKAPSGETNIRMKAETGSYDRHREQFTISGGSKRLAGSLYGSFEENDGYRDNSDLRAKDIGGKVKATPNDIFEFTLQGSYHEDDYGMPGALSEKGMRLDREATNSPNDEASTEDGYLQGSMEMDLGTWGRFISDVSYRDRQTDSDWISSNYRQESQMETWAFTPRYNWEGELFGYFNSLVAGVDLYWSDLKNETSTQSKADIEKNSQGYYINNELSLFDELILTLGYRFENADYDLQQKDFGMISVNDTVDEREEAYTAGLTYLYDDRSSAFVRVNRSLRYPMTGELIEYSFNDYKYQINNDLNPQVGTHYEVGLRHYLFSSLMLRATLFRSEIEDEIFYNPMTYSNENHEETLHQGFEFGSQLDFLNYYTIRANYTYTDAEFTKEPFDGNDIPAVPEHKVNLYAQVHDLIPHMKFSLNYQYVDSSYAISDQANVLDKKSDYSTLDVRLSYDVNGVRLFAGVDNITGEEYSEYAVKSGGLRNFYPAPEETWFAGIEVEL